ncbi:MAG TPA: hypothetical protein PLD88_03955, partial [Candidatus Berkiella sp.]|nr:hypothetical protein [Candidatus Berkiella sp.]
PIMIAALTQNVDAIVQFAEKAKLSNNQRLIYLWIAQAPYQHLAEIQRNIEQYGHIPGFVPPQWKMPSQFQKLQHEQKPE